MTRVNDQSEVVAKDVGEFQEIVPRSAGDRAVGQFPQPRLAYRAGGRDQRAGGAGRRLLVGMKLLGIDLQRISLGAMIIALGLLVDDAIIAVETMTVKLEQGWDRLRAGSFAYTSTAFPMLTGTLVTAAGYLPVGLAQSSHRRIHARHLPRGRHGAGAVVDRRGGVRPLSRRALAAGTARPHAGSTTSTDTRTYRPLPPRGRVVRAPALAR